MYKSKLQPLNNILILIFLSCISFTSWGDIDKKMLLEDEARKMPDNFYIQKSNDISKVNTVTYFITKSRPNNNLLNIFYDYAKSIGSSNGAVIININDKLILDNKDNEYFKYLINMGCDIPKNNDELPVLIFEHKHSKKCFTFKRVNDEGFDATLIQLFNTRMKLKEMGNLEVNSELQLIVNDALKNFPIYQDNKLALRDMINFITK